MKIRTLLGWDTPSRRVALVLSGGGARGLAHIGAIEELQDRGYEITSIAGTSMGALVAGAYAAGKMGVLKQRITEMKPLRMLGMIDVSLGLDHVVGGKKVMQLMQDILGDVRIEDLPIPYCCCATDLSNGQEVVFREGSLREAIRASISIPGVFKPERMDGHVLVDGSVHNTLPLDRVARQEGDILMAVNASAPCSYPLPPSKGKFILSENYVKFANYVIDLMVTVNTQMALRLTPPAVCANVPTNRYGIFEFDKARDIIAYGRRVMREQLDAYEAAQR